MANILMPLYILSIISSVIAAVLAVIAIRFSIRTENRLKTNFTHIQKYMNLNIEKTEDLLDSLGKEAETIRTSVHQTRLELLDSIESVHRIREEILDSMQSLENSCIIKEDEDEK